MNSFWVESPCSPFDLQKSRGSSVVSSAGLPVTSAFELELLSFRATDG